MRSYLRRYLGITIAGQIHQKTVFAQIKIIEMLRTPRRFAGVSQAHMIGQRVDGAGLAVIGTSGKSNFHPAMQRKVLKVIDCGKKLSS